MVNLLDDNVGRLVAMLKSAGLWNNTLMVATSDNGGPLGEGYGGNNYPLKGGKASNWEGGVRANAFAAGGVIPAARRFGARAIALPSTPQTAPSGQTPNRSNATEHVRQPKPPHWCPKSTRPGSSR
jgi:hypothetical protein